MDYKVVPFTATLNQKKDTTSAIADQLESVIRHYSNQGWEYERLENVATYVQPDSGCFGLGAKPIHLASYQMIVFSKG